MKKLNKFLFIIMMAIGLPVAAFAYDATEEITCNTDVLQSDSSAIFVANWNPISYNISYTLNGGAYGAEHPNTADYATAFTVSNPTHINAVFAGWEITGMDASEHTFGSTTNSNTTFTTSETSFENLTSVDGATVTFTAKWTCNTGYSGNNCIAKDVELFYFDGLTNEQIVDTTPTTCTYDTTFNLPDVPTKVGYTFAGWELVEETQTEP